MRKRERYKRLIMFLASVLIIALQTGVFAYAWFHDYYDKDIIGRMYGYWGHWALLGLYALLVLLVSKLFSAFKVGYMRILDVILSQIFSVLLVNVFEYFQLSLIGHWKFLTNLEPMLRVTGVNLILVVLWVVFMRLIYAKIYPPHEVLVIYDRFGADQLLHKLSERKDKYLVTGTMALSEGVEKIKAEIPNYQAVMLGDLPAHERNLFLKYYF